MYGLGCFCSFAPALDMGSCQFAPCPFGILPSTHVFSEHFLSWHQETLQAHLRHLLPQPGISYFSKDPVPLWGAVLGTTAGVLLAIEVLWLPGALRWQSMRCVGPDLHVYSCYFCPCLVSVR